MVVDATLLPYDFDEMPSRNQDLPDYEQPPVVEVAFSVQYEEEIADFSMAHAGRFWANLGSEFPRVKEASQIQSVVEQADNTVRGVSISFGDLPPPRRLQIEHEKAGWVIQLQPDRFLVNWRAESPDDDYPRFEACFSQFQKYRKQFEDYCTKSGLTLPQANQYELTYINHVQQGTGWNSYADVGAVFPDIGWRTNRKYLPNPKNLSWSTVFDMPDGPGRLHASVKTARKKSDNTEVLIFDLTARGFPANSKEDEQEGWFKVAREWIVKGFSDLTNPKIQADVWRRKQ